MQSPGISLSYQCPKKWGSMSPADGGRFCSDCQKVVRDFSKAAVAELQKTIPSNCEEELCGNFHAYQLHKPFGNWKDQLISFYQNISIAKTANRFSLLLVMAALLLTGCYRHVRGRTYISQKDWKKKQRHYTE